MHGPDPNALHPVEFTDTIVFLKPLARDRFNVEIGDFTYFHANEDAESFFDKNVLYHFEFTGDRLVIGPFCAIAAETRFIMSGSMHSMGGLSTYPFAIFGEGWDEGFDYTTWEDEKRGDTIVGGDVWIGYGATIMPGVKIGEGAVVAAKSVVTQDVPPFSIVGGNPARVIRPRFEPETVERLVRLAWWNWPAEKITRHLPAIRASDIDALEAAE